MKNFIIVQVDYKYCDYLRKYDERVPYNSGIKRNRPFVGVLFTVGEIEYFTPLSSPKEKHKKMKNHVDFIKLSDGKLGAINFNNMIPVRKDVYNKLNLRRSNVSKKEKQYYFLLESQLSWLNKNKENVGRVAKNLYELYISSNLDVNVRKRCCNFPLLEEKCKDYLKTINHN